MNPNNAIPHNMLAEQAYIAHLLIDPDSTLNNTEISITSEDFFDTKHQLIFETAEMLHTNYKTVNPIEVVTALKNAGRLADAGGIQYITQTINPANATSYGTNPVGLAMLIQEDKQRRDLLDASYRISEAASPGSGNEAEEALAVAESEVFTLLNKQTQNSQYDFTVKGIVDDVIENIKNISEAPEGATPNGVPSGFDALDDMTTGFKGGQFILIAARPGIGKALDVNTEIQTIEGRKLLKDITENDYVYGMNGKPYPVIKAHETFCADEAYIMYFSDGSTLTANGDHVWLTETRQARKQRNISRARRKNFSVTQIEKLNKELSTSSSEDLMSIQNVDQLLSTHMRNSKKFLEMLSHLEVIETRMNAKVSSVSMNTYNTAQVMGSLQSTKRIQEHTDSTVYTKVANYVHSSTTQMMTVPDIANLVFGDAKQEEISYIRNLISSRNIKATDKQKTQRSISQTPELLFNKRELLELCISFGNMFKNDQRTENAVLSPKTTKEIFKSLKVGSDNRSNHSIPKGKEIESIFFNNKSVSVEERKKFLSTYEGNKLATTSKELFDKTLLFASSLGYLTMQTVDSNVFRISWREQTTADVYITDMKIVSNIQMRCLTVASPDSMFLAGTSFTPTHNSTLAVDFSRNASFLDGKTVLFFSLEMDQVELTTRILSAEGRVETTKLKKGTLDEIDWMNISEAKQKLQNGNFILKTNPNYTISQIRAACMKQKMQPEGLDMVVIDYLQLIGMNKKVPRQEAVSEASRELKLLAKELDVPIIVLSQLNRKSEERQDGKPSVSDLRESGSLEQDADIVFLLHRPEANDANNRPGQTDLIIGKHRGGPVGIIPLTSMLQFSKFVPGTGLIEREEEFNNSDDDESGIQITTEAPW